MLEEKRDCNSARELMCWTAILTLTLMCSETEMCVLFESDVAKCEVLVMSCELWWSDLLVFCAGRWRWRNSTVNIETI